MPGPPLEGDVRADVCIVGGGYTGLWTAYFLKQAEPDLTIRVIEADYAGSGASGHNDGFMTPTIGHSLHTVVRGWGNERAKLAYTAAGRSIMEIRRFALKHDIECDIEPNGFYLVATTDGQRRRLELDVSLAAGMGFSYDILDGASARDRIGSAALRGALKTAGALVNPHKLARGLTRVVRTAGVQVHEGTRVLDIARVSGGHMITMPHARLTADRLVLATNAFQHQWRPFHNRVKPVWSYAAVTEPLRRDQLAQVHWPDREGFVEARNFILFGRLTADDRLLIGGGPAPYFYGRDMADHHIVNSRISDVLAETLRRYFPMWRDVRFTHSYGGCIAVTRDLVPHVGQLRDGTCYAYGYCGNGITMAHVAGKALRDLVLGRETPNTDLLFVRGKEPAYPPEPLTFLGARALAAALAHQDRHPSLLKRQIL